MNELKLVNINEINPVHLSYESPESIRQLLNGYTIIDPESLPIVKELRESLCKAEKETQYWKDCCSAGASSFEPRHLLENQPPVDPVEVIRCMECEHFCDPGLDGCQGFCMVFKGFIGRNGFCSYGRRK